MRGELCRTLLAARSREADCTFVGVCFAAGSRNTSIWQTCGGCVRSGGSSWHAPMATSARRHTGALEPDTPRLPRQGLQQDFLTSCTYTEIFTAPKWLLSLAFKLHCRLEAETPEDLAAAAKQSELLAAQAKQARAAAAAAKERQERVDAGTPRQQQISSRLGRTGSADSLQGGRGAMPTPGDQPAQPGSATGVIPTSQLP
jgi:hypothetical protein